MSTLEWFDGWDELIRPIVYQRRVWDLGCGFKNPALPILARLGAANVVLVDKDMVIPRPIREKVGVGVRQYTLFSELEEKWKEAPENDVALISWPANSGATGLDRVLMWFPTVIYIGANSDGTACGDKDLWEHLTMREVIHYDPQRKNSLIVYGTQAYMNRPKLLEEVWALDHKEMHPFVDHLPIRNGHTK